MHVRWEAGPFRAVGLQATHRGEDAESRGWGPPHGLPSLLGELEPAQPGGKALSLSPGPAPTPDHIPARNRDTRAFPAAKARERPKRDPLR